MYDSAKYFPAKLTRAKTSFEIIATIFPNQANSLYNLLQASPDTFRTLYPDLAIMLPEFKATPAATPPTPADLLRKRMVCASSKLPTSYRDGYFETQPTKHHGAVPRWALVVARGRPNNGWAWGAVAFGKAVFFEAYWPEGEGLIDPPEQVEAAQL